MQQNTSVRRRAPGTILLPAPAAPPAPTAPPCPLPPTFAVLVTLALLWTGYVVWPLYQLFQLARAIERADVAEVTRRVDFPRVGRALTQQIIEAYLQRTGARAGPIAGAAASIADPLV